MRFAGLVPGDTPFENLTKDPPPGVGAYKLTESVPNREFVMEKIHGFADLDIPDIPTWEHRQDHDRDREEPDGADTGRAQQRPGLHAGPAAG